MKRILEKISIFKGLSEDELNSLTKLCDVRTYKRGDMIFTERKRGDEIYILTKGRVRIELGIANKTDYATIHRVQKGEIFGELAIVDEGGRSASAECETDDTGLHLLNPSHLCLGAHFLQNNFCTSQIILR